MTNPDDALVERVARAICEDAVMAHHCSVACALCKVNARAAIAVALEEAAKVADWPYPASAGWNEEQAGRIAAANDIRALKDNL